MREILFRGKSETGTWIYGVPLVYAEDVIVMTFPFNRSGIVIPETVGQYTGLNDKNGQKIFEGDIVKKSWIYRYTTGRGEEEKLNSFTGVVIFDRGQFGLSLDENMDFDEFIGENKSDKWTEVIGNIHDNQELLEGVK